MPKVMIRKNESGEMTLYVAKKDLEETVVSIEYEGPEKWGGEVELADGTKYFLDPVETMPNLPVTLRAKRV